MCIRPIVAITSKFCRILHECSTLWLRLPLAAILNVVLHREVLLFTCHCYQKLIEHRHRVLLFFLAGMIAYWAKQAWWTAEPNMDAGRALETAHKRRASNVFVGAPVPQDLLQRDVSVAQPQSQGQPQPKASPQPPVRWPYSPWQQAMLVRPQVGDLVLIAIADHGDNDLKEQYLLQAYAAQPNSLLVNYHLLSHCVQNPASGMCGLPFIDTLLALDGHNLATLLNVAVYYANLGDHSQARYYLALAAKGTVQQDYVLRHLLAIDASFGRHHLTRDFTALAEYFRVAVASSIPDYRQLVQFCDASLADLQTERLCANLGQRLQEQSKSALDQLVGGAIKLRYGRLGKAELALHTWQQQARSGQDLQVLEGLEDVFQDNGQVILSDTAWQHYLRQYQTQGEVAATVFLKAYLGQVSEQNRIATW